MLINVPPVRNKHNNARCKDPIRIKTQKVTDPEHWLQDSGQLCVQLEISQAYIPLSSDSMKFQGSWKLTTQKRNEP
jgi:hypothetical protein